MAKRHQGKQQPTYKSLKAEGKIMTPEGVATLKKRGGGRGGGKRGYAGDLNVWGRYTGDSSDRTKNRKKVSAKKTAKRRGQGLLEKRGL
jgi:hypothetical protein